MNPIVRKVFPENLRLEKDKFPVLDIFICTADPYKEPPLNVVNTALSVMAYDYPTDKISVYVSDDGGSQLTLFAFMEAAKFARSWLPFCVENDVMERCPDSFFRSHYSTTSATQNIKMMYDDMKTKIETVVEKGTIPEEYITAELEHEAFNKWKQGFTRQDHPTIIQVLLESGKDRDITGNSMPNLIYVSREKSKTSPHHFKAGALNALLRVSAIMTNAPLLLTLDCDMFSNDPKTAHKALCFLTDRSFRPNLGYIQFPQRYHGLNRADIYASEFKGLFITNAIGMDGLQGPNYVGTGCFFDRRVFFGGPSELVDPQIPELRPDYVASKPVSTRSVMDLAHHVAGCKFESRSTWGSKLGFRYGSLVEDYYTGYRLQCEGWQSLLCHPERPAFLGDVPISLTDVLNQNKRWSVGLLEVAFSKYSTVTYGVRALGPVVANAWSHYAFWPVWSIPITVYAFLPQLALLNSTPIFPKASDAWFVLYLFMFMGAYVQDCMDFVLADGTFERWWSDQRMWTIRGLSSYAFGTIEYLMKHLGMPTHGFNITSKVVDDEQSKRYDQGMFEFGVESPMFLPLSVAALLNLIAFLVSFFHVFKEGYLDRFVVQIFIAGFGILNSLPMYKAMFLRADKGRMPTPTTLTSTFVVVGLYISSYLVLNIG